MTFVNGKREALFEPRCPQLVRRRHTMQMWQSAAWRDGKLLTLCRHTSTWKILLLKGEGEWDREKERERWGKRESGGVHHLMERKGGGGRRREGFS